MVTWTSLLAMLVSCWLVSTTLTANAQVSSVCAPVDNCGSCVYKKNDFGFVVCQWCFNTSTCLGTNDATSVCGTDVASDYAVNSSQCSTVSESDLLIIIVVGSCLGLLIAVGVCYFFYSNKKKKNLRHDMRRAEARDRKHALELEVEMVNAQRLHAMTVVANPAHVAVTADPPNGHRVQFHNRGSKRNLHGSPQPGGRDGVHPQQQRQQQQYHEQRQAAGQRVQPPTSEVVIAAGESAVFVPVSDAQPLSRVTPNHPTVTAPLVVVGEDVGTVTAPADVGIVFVPL